MSRDEPGGAGWRVWIDTGGTFTDGVAIDPRGTVRRVKLLSSAALRSRVAGVGPDGRIELDSALGVDPAALAGLRCRRVADRDDRGTTVLAYDDRAATLELEQSPAALAIGDTLELSGDDDAPLFAARLLTGTAPGAPLPATRMRVATTVGTNALLEGRGAAVALFLSEGFGDLTVIGDQQRPELFALRIERPAPLHSAVIEVPGRLAADGSELAALDTSSIERDARALLEQGVRSAAVALLHSWRDPGHELELARRLREWGFEHVSCSAELAPRIKLLTRAETAIVDATLAPVFDRFMHRTRTALGEGELLMMTSAGGLVGPSVFRPKDGLLSGPAGGVAGAACAARLSGVREMIGFDMGGTSTDVARYDGEFDYVFEHRVGAARLAAPALAIETVAAGGGSICRFSAERLQVGPQSAGAEPGPACYGAGGPLTVTDVNLLLGRVDPDRFRIPIDERPALERLRELADAVAGHDERPAETTRILEGLLEIADEIMADAMRRVSVRRGDDPTAATLVAFGGAGGQHACRVAERLGIRRVLVPADAALLSAWGLGAAVVERFEEAQLLEPLAGVEASLAARFAPLESAAIEAVASAGVARPTIVVRRRLVHLRLAGQDSTLDLDWVPEIPLAGCFAEAYERIYGHRPTGPAIEVESIRVVASSDGETRADDEPLSIPQRSAAQPTSWRRARFDGRWVETPVFERSSLTHGARFDGPALVVETTSCCVVEPGWTARVDAQAALLLDFDGDPARRRTRLDALTVSEPGEKAGEPDAVSAIDTPDGGGRGGIPLPGDADFGHVHDDDAADDATAGDSGTAPQAVQLELFAQRFGSIVREMGVQLERTAISTNVKERLDFSCALLDPQGALVANAPHIPVHLGALGPCVRSLCRALEMRPGDVVVTNHPGHGGSHLPDVTVVTPVFERTDGGELLGYVASRAHHAEIGGTRPGSMSPDAVNLADEGVVIPPLRLFDAGRPCWETMRRLLLDAPHPTRRVEDNLADLRAAVAAGRSGVEALRRLNRRHGREVVSRFMAGLRRLADSEVRRAWRALGDGCRRATQQLDDGTPLAVRIETVDGRATIDFDGSGALHPGNLNAPAAVVRSAVLYVVRVLIDAPLPLNEGLLDSIDLRLPPGLLNPPFGDDPRCDPAVAGGNVETSQRIVDTLLAALGIVACSQGTMNNVVFGDQTYAYYETLGGGSGAGPGFDGAHGVHTHMTNTRITDVEILEQRYPVRVRRFALRRGSGGAGRWPGGDGLIRDIEFLAPATLSLLTQHRVERPYGMNDGEDGAAGRQKIRRADGRVDALSSVDGAELNVGDRLIIETPGGGGWGSSDS